jgi:hypothetical protein
LIIVGFDYGNKVRGLLALADSEEALGNTEAAQAARDRAFHFMREYQVDLDSRLATDHTAEVPTHRVMDVRVSYEMAAHYVDMIRSIAEHVGVRLHNIYAGFDTGNRTLRTTMVGFEGDLDYAELLWTSAHLMFATKIDVRWDPSLSVDENIYRMRAAGHKRKDIAEAAGWDGNKASDRSKVQRIYTREVAKRGEVMAAAGLGFNSNHYRESYAQAFVNTLRWRLRKARNATDSNGGALVLGNRDKAIEDAFYDLFPQMRPSTAVAEPYVAPNAHCERCKRAASGFCREHNWLKPRTWTKADEARHQARTRSGSARAGRALGQDAAEGVVIARGAKPSGRVERSGNAIES